jgi:hypothetical protein
MLSSHLSPAPKGVGLELALLSPQVWGEPLPWRLRASPSATLDEENQHCMRTFFI